MAEAQLGFIHVCYSTALLKPNLFSAVSMSVAQHLKGLMRFSSRENFAPCKFKS